MGKWVVCTASMSAQHVGVASTVGAAVAHQDTRTPRPASGGSNCACVRLHACVCARAPSVLLAALPGAVVVATGLNKKGGGTHTRRVNARIKQTSGTCGMGVYICSSNTSWSGTERDSATPPSTLPPFLRPPTPNKQASRFEFQWCPAIGCLAAGSNYGPGTPQLRLRAAMHALCQRH